MVLSDALMNCGLWFGEDLSAVVLRFGMLWEVLSVFAVDDKIEISEMMESALCKHLKFDWPDDSNAHVLTGVSNNGTSKKIWINGHEAFLVKAEICEELSILLEVFSQLDGWLISDI